MRTKMLPAGELAPNLQAALVTYGGLSLVEAAAAFATDSIVICEIPSLEIGARIIYVNASFTRITGYAPEDVLGKSPYLLHDSTTSPEDVFAMMLSLPAGRSAALELATYRKDGSKIWLEVSFVPLKDERNVLRHSITFQRDITMRKELEEAAIWSRVADTAALQSQKSERMQAQAKLAHSACHDLLTGLANRALFIDRLRISLLELDKQGGPLSAVLALDCDRFKLINDSYGHAIGDRLLVEIARRLERSVRCGDTFARLGGDEFTMLLAGVENVEGAIAIAERLLTSLAEPFEVDGHEMYVTASIGIALSSPGAEPEDIVRDADIAMYRAKGLGKNRYQIFASELRVQSARKHLIEMELRRALDRSEISVAYQPVISLAHGRLRGFEALARWNHPTLGPIFPAEFIPVAEETGLIVPLGRTILREACMQMKHWESAFPSTRHLSVSVNASASELVAERAVARLGETLVDTGLDPSRLAVEVTESALMQDPERAARSLRRLRALGVAVHMDDFGTGYSSLAYLHQFSFDALKIDRSFVSGEGDDLANPQIVETVIALARHLHLSVTAEGIETEQQARALRALRCENGQGYFLGRPLSESAAAAFIARDLTNALPLQGAAG